jgi:hypothetical protein
VGAVEDRDRPEAADQHIVAVDHQGGAFVDAEHREVVEPTLAPGDPAVEARTRDQAVEVGHRDVALQRPEAGHLRLRARRFDDPALTAAFDHYLATVQTREAALGAVEDDLALWCETGRSSTRCAGRAPTDITHLGGLLLASETCDWPRFPTAGHYMGEVGLVPPPHWSAW